MSPLQSIIRSIPTTADEIGIVESVRARLTEIGEIDRRCRPDGPAWINGAFCWLHHEVDRLADELAQAPSLEGADRLSAAIVRLRDAPASIEPIAACLRHAAARILAELGPVIGKIFDAAAEKLAAEISARRAELAKGSVTLFDVQAELAAFDNRGVQLHAQLATEREGALGNPLQFLQAHIEPAEAPAPAPAPAQPVKSYRGKVRLDKTAEVETQADDVLSGLADEDEIDLEDPLELLAGGN